MRARDIVQQVLLRVQPPSLPSNDAIARGEQSNKKTERVEHRKHKIDIQGKEKDNPKQLFGLYQKRDESCRSTLFRKRPSSYKTQAASISEDHSSSTCTTSISCCSSGTRSVCFDDTSNQWIETDTYLTKDDCRHIWYTQNEYQRFKSSCMELVKCLYEEEQLRAGETGEEPECEETLLNLYSACCLTTQEPQRPPLHTSSKSLCMTPSCWRNNSTFNTGGVGNIITKAEERKLNQLYDGEIYGTMLVGLERYMCRSIYRDKYQRRIRLVHLVYEIQDTYLNGLQSPFNDELADELRRECQNMSRASRLFAQHLAVAQMNQSDV